MPTYFDPDIRAAKLVDLPVLRRLTEQASVLDSELGCTRDTIGVHGALISGGLWARDHYTLVGKAHKQMIAGQIHVLAADRRAQIVFVAPSVHDESADNTALLHLLDAMASEAGRRGAHTLTAEVDEMSPLFVSLRSAGFAVYARQELWRGTVSTHIEPAMLTKETGDDAFDIQQLYASIVPRLVQSIVIPSTDSEGYVYRENGQVRGYVALTEGRSGIYVVPFFHADLSIERAMAVLAGAIAQSSRADKLPITVCIRRYQEWLNTALELMGFVVTGEQAVMVRHIAAGVRQPTFASFAQVLDAIPAGARTPGQRPIRLTGEFVPVSHSITEEPAPPYLVGV
ncbi:MAG: hypothetical protein U0670_12990 [Anaerolineae bacterium]